MMADGKQAIAEDRIYYIPLPSRDILLTLFDYDPETGVLSWRPRVGMEAFNARYAGRPAGAITPRGYWKVSVYIGGRRKNMFTHRIIWKIMTDNDPIDIDHINRIKNDNRWLNLREVTSSQNGYNKTDQNGQPMGVFYSKGQDRWIANISLKGKQRSLGAYKTRNEAIAARIGAIKALNLEAFIPAMIRAYEAGGGEA